MSQSDDKSNVSFMSSIPFNAFVMLLIWAIFMFVANYILQFFEVGINLTPQ